MNGRHSTLFYSVTLISIATVGCEGRPPSTPNAKTGVPEEEFVKFPWPPPTASATFVIPDGLIRQTNEGDLLVRDVDEMIRNALNARGYSERSYYAVPGGFAIVTRLEQFNEDGSSKEPPGRWSQEVLPMGSFSIRNYIAALFTANPGNYRIIVFVVSSILFDQSGVDVTRDEAMAWLKKGLNGLPDDVGADVYTKSHVCTALIYEFEQLNKGGVALQKIPGRCTGSAHLENAGLLSSFRE